MTKGENSVGQVVWCCANIRLIGLEAGRGELGEVTYKNIWLGLCSGTAETRKFFRWIGASRYLQVLGQVRTELAGYYPETIIG